MKTIISHRYSSAQLIVLILLIQIWDSQTVSAQRYFTTFGQVMSFRTGAHPRHLVGGDFNGDGKADLALVFDDHLLFKYRDSSGFHNSTLHIDGGIIDVVPANLNTDKRTDFLVVTATPPAVEAYISRPRDQYQRLFRQQLDPTIDHLLVADINNDGKPDLLFYGKKHLGITLFLGKGGGQFQHEQLILAEYSFGVLNVADINNDGMAEVIGTDWLSNDIMVFSSFGKLRYGSPVRIHGESEPAFVCCSPFVHAEGTDLIVAYPESHSLDVYTNTTSGDFRLAHTQSYEGETRGLFCADINNDGQTDIALLTDRGLVVELNDGNGGVGPESEFAAGKNPSEFILLAEGRQHYVGAAILDTGRGSVRYLRNARETGPVQDEEYYGTGLSPAGILKTDINGDHFDDIIVANSGSRSLGIFPGSRNGSYGGQISIESSIPVQTLRHVSSTDSLVTLVGTSDVAESIVVIGINPQTVTHRLMTLPTQGIPDILFARTDTATDLLHLFALEYPPASGAGQLIEYEQIPNSRFVERTYRSLTHDPIIGAAMYDVNHDSYPDLIFATYNASQHRVDITLARGNANEEFSGARRIASLEEREFPHIGLWCEDMNGDGRPDILLNVHAPENCVYLFLGKDDTTFSPVAGQLRGEMKLESRNDLEVLPHGPGRRTELVMNNGVLRILQVFTVREDGLLAPMAKLFSTEGLGGFCLSGSDKSEADEIAITDRLQGELRVVRIGGSR